MSSADSVIAAWRSGHDHLAGQVAGFTDEELTRASGAADWDVSTVLGHLGSASEIGRGLLQASIDDSPRPDQDVARSVWAHWDAMSPRERADGFVTASDDLISRYEALDEQTRDDLRIDLGFLPAPVDVATAAGLRLREHTLHSWDVRVGFDEAATLAPEAVEQLLHRGPDLTSWISRPDELDGLQAVVRVTTSEPASEFALRLEDRIAVDVRAPEAAEAELTLPAEAWLRLVAGRLAPERTPSSVSISGPVDLDTLRRVFPGY